MRITIVTGFFLPMPPAAGGATEKSWDGLAREFAKRGHDVTIVSRQWPGWPDRETVEGVRHIRLGGYDHTHSLRRNLWRDLRWSWRVGRILPPADVTVLNCLALPIWLGWWRGRAGHLAVMPGRMPKGQYRFYRRIDRVLAVGSAVRDAVLTENPGLTSVTKIFGYPIDWKTLARPRPVPAGAPLTIGYIGRLHREKGLELLAAALELLERQPGVPPWRLLLCGPAAVEQGGSGEAYLAPLRQRLANLLPADRLSFRPPLFEAQTLVATYREIDIFCYPSLAVRGETFGVAVAEAMAAGAVPVVSQLSCFTDFVVDGKNGEVFDHTSANAPERLATVLTRLLSDRPRRERLARNAQSDVRTYDFPEFAARLLADFSALK